MSYKIETHDYGVRIKNAKKFVTQGHRVSGGGKEGRERKSGGGGGEKREGEMATNDTY